MIEEWLAIPNIDLYFVLGVLILFGAIETILGHYSNTNRTKDDWVQESIGFFIVAITKAILFLAIVFIGDALLPAASDILSHWSLWLAFPFYILIDDCAQYWYHRSAHEYNWLWKHHRPHHAAQEMGILVAYRNSWVYYLLMPNIWWAGIATYLGMAPAVILGLIFKQIVVTSTHSSWRWDEIFYKHKVLRPIAWVVEHILITPAFHHGHHGTSMADHVSDPNGNYGNTFSLWDQLFGTAKFTRDYPAEYGLQTDPKDSWAAHVLYPFVKSNKEGSEIGAGHKKVKTASLEAATVELEAGTYLWCQCGFSNNQPFCDGSHHGSKFKPLVFELEKKKKLKLCKCKHTKVGPFCDNTHLKVKEDQA